MSFQIQLYSTLLYIDVIFALLLLSVFKKIDHAFCFAEE